MKHSILSPLRQGVSLALVLVGAWILHLTADFSHVEDTLESWANHPVFLSKTLSLPYYEKENKSFVEQILVNRWAFFQTPISSPEQPVTSETEEKAIPLLPPSPQMIPEEATAPSEEVEGNWVSHTMLPNDSYAENQGIYVVNNGKVPLTEEIMSTFSTTTLAEVESPQILIYHSHGTESYAQTTGYTYVESDPYRTLNNDFNITEVGRAMVEVFESAGFSVIHDTSLHDYPDYNQSYQNSGVSVAEYIETYPSLQLILDVHRDALSTSDGTPYQLVSQQGDETVAQVMLVVGTNGDGYAHPNWQENFSLALTLQQGLLEYGDFARPITLRSSRFNQQYSTACLLLEVGGHGNTLVQAIAGARLFSQSVVATLSK